jgi:subtilisin family serine protease
MFRPIFPERGTPMKKLLVIALVCAVLNAGMALGQPYANPSIVGQVPDRVVITVKAGVTMALDKSAGAVSVGVPSLDALSQRFQVRDMDQMHAGLTTNFKDKAAASYFDRVWSVDFPAEMGLERVKKAYEALPEVEEVRVVDICKLYDAYLPNDLSNSQYYLRNMTPGGGDIRAVGAWNQALGDSNVIVAVIDSGVDWHHPDLGGSHPDKVNGAIWTNWAEYYGNPGQDDDGNGKIDDIRGWDFVNLPASQGWPDEDVTNQDNDPMDYESHGTNCSGCVAAITNNGIGIAGTAHGCKIMALRVGWLPAGSDQGVVRMDFVSQAMLYAINNGAKILNCSWGSSEFLANPVNSAISAGLLIVTAAGNDDDEVPSYLGSRTDVLAVAATDQSDAKSSFSSYGSWVELSAPGVSIYTTAYNRSTGESVYASVNGTSFSSPITCGAAALLWSANPDFTRVQIAELLTSSCDNIDAVNPAYIGKLGAGRVNMLKALGDNMHRFPSEFPTLFDAMNSAAEGDTVGIEGGETITGPVTIIGDKDLNIFAGYNADYTSRDPLNNKAVITGNLANTVVKFAGEVGPGTILDGLLISGGGGQNYSGIPYNARYGGGVILNQVSPTLRNIEITGNSVGLSNQLGCGGGLMMNGSSSLLENVHIHGNTGIYGGGLFAYNSSATLVDCVIEGNTPLADNPSYPPRGGGLYAVDSALTLTNTTVNGHQEVETGGGMFLTQSTGATSLDMTGGSVSENSAKANGGGIYMDGGTASLTGVAINDNTKTATSTFMSGGGFYFAATSVTLDSLTVSGNQSQTGGGGTFLDCPTASLTNSVLSANSAQFWGGGLNAQGTSNGTIGGNTVTANEGTLSGGGGFYLNNSSLALENNLVAFNTGGAGGNGVTGISSTPTFSCNDVFGNTGSDFSGVTDPTGSDGNISADPLFCGFDTGNYNLGTGSPCLPENSGSCGLIGALPGGCGGEVPVPEDQTVVPLAFRVEQNFPNPFNPKTTIRFALPEAGRTSVTIYDVAGHLIKTVVDDVLPAQVHQVTWTGDDDNGRTVAAGVYFYLVNSGEHRSVGRMALVK